MAELDGTAPEEREKSGLIRKTVVDMLKWSSIAVAEERIANDTEDECSDEAQ